MKGSREISHRGEKNGLYSLSVLHDRASVSQQQRQVSSRFRPSECPPTADGGRATSAVQQEQRRHSLVVRVCRGSKCSC